MEPMIIFCFVDIIFIILGSIFTIVSFLVNKHFNEKKERCRYKTVGNIVDIKKRISYIHHIGKPNEKMVSEVNCYEYECNFQKLKVWGNIGNMPGKFQIGQQVTLYCNPNNPNEFYSEEESSKTVITVLKFVGIGVLALAIILTTIIIMLLGK